MTGRKQFLAAGLAGAAALGLAAVAPAQTKGLIERPTERVLAAATAGPAAAADGFANPKVPPGKVRWHASFEDACRAARASGKPVLLFQMMGRLDEKFC
jgi:hypothetical protein